MSAASSPPHAPPGPATVAATLPDESWRTWSGLWHRRTNLIAGGSLLAIIGSISLCARQAIIVKSPVVLEQIAGCRTAIFDKTGTLTCGEPKLTERVIAPGFVDRDALSLVAERERYSKHPLARAILAAAREESLVVPEATEVSEAPGQGLRGTVSGRQVRITSRNQMVTEKMAGVVVMDNSLSKVDEFMHISRRIRVTALQSAVGGMALSIVGMGLAATGHLTPVSGAIAQEVIEVLAVLNARRAACPPKVIRDL